MCAVSCQMFSNSISVDRFGWSGGKSRISNSRIRSPLLGKANNESGFRSGDLLTFRKRLQPAGCLEMLNSVTGEDLSHSGG